jgi:hypothetical protein
MGSNLQVTRWALAFATLSMSVVGCHGAPSGSSTFVPSDASRALVNPGSSVNPAKVPIEIKSTCGDRIHIVVAGIIDCKFKERDYGGNFKVTVATKGLVSISPTKGTEDTTFTVTGLVLGKGYFLVRDDKANVLKVRVHVTV